MHFLDIDDKIINKAEIKKVDFKECKESLDLWDKIFENAINSAIEKATVNYEEMKYK